MQTAKVGDTAQWISKVDGTPHLGDVIEAGETYADVQWRQNGRVERIQFSHPDGVTFEHVIHHVSECSRPYDWSGEHLFEDDEVELNPKGYDEYERCGLPADDPLHVEGAHAAALRRNALEDRLAQGAPFVARVRWYRTATGVGLREGWQAMVDEDHAAALKGRLVWDDGTDFTYSDGGEFHATPGPPCDAGGLYWHPDLAGPAVYEPPCTQPPTHRFRAPRMVDGHWGHRCAQHVAWLDRDICTVEPLVAPAALCLRAGDHWPHMTAVSPDCRTLPTDQQ